MNWRDEKDIYKNYGLTREYKPETPSLPPVEEQFAEEMDEDPAIPANPAPPAKVDKVVVVDKQFPSPVRVLGKLIESVQTETYEIRIYKQLDASYFGQCTYFSDGRIIEAHGDSLPRVSFDLRHLAAQGVKASDLVDPEFPRSNKVPGKLA